MNHTMLNWLVIAGDILLKATLLLALGWIATLVARRSSAAVRNMIWLVALSATLLVPALEVVAPMLSLITVSSPSITLVKPDFQIPLEAAPIEPIAQPSPVSRPPSRSEILVIWAGVAWAGGGLAVMISVFAGWVALSRIRTHGLSLPAEVNAAGAGRVVRLRISREGRPPSALTWGALHPTILLPKAAESWPEDRLQTVLLHELEHVRRWDATKQFVGLAACALYWFNPLVWLAARAARSEAEAATDDAVLRAGIRPSAYANTLMEVAAEISRFPGMQTSAGVAFMKKSKIEARVRAILDNRARRGTTRTEKVVALTLAVAAVGSLAVVRAAVVKPFAELPDPADQLVVTQSQAAPHKMTAAERAHARHLKALANQLDARMREYRAAQAKTMKLQANIDELSWELGKAPSHAAQLSEVRLIERLRMAERELARAESSLRMAPPPPPVALQLVAPAGDAFATQPPKVGLAAPDALAPAPPLLARPSRDSLAPVPPAPPVQRAEKAKAEVFAATAARAAIDQKLLAEREVSLAQLLAERGQALSDDKIKARQEAEAMVDGSRGSDDKLRIERQLMKAEVRARDEELNALVAKSAADTDSIAKVRALKVELEKEQSVAAAKNHVQNYQQRQEAWAKLKAITDRDKVQERYNLQYWLEARAGDRQSTAALESKLKALQAKMATGKLSGDSLKRAKLEVERVRLLIRLKSIEADLAKK